MHGLIEAQRRRHKHKSPYRHFRYGQRAAARKALTAAKLRLGIPLQRPSSVRGASEQCGANPVYTAAMITLLKAEDKHALDLVLRGSWSLLETAARLKPRADLIAAFRKTSSSDHAALGRATGPDVMWDDCIAPII